MLLVANKKRTLLLTAARELFWKHGFRRVTIEEVCERAGVSKMTFYRFFPNKVDLAKTVFNHVAEEGLQRFRAILAEDTSREEKTRRFVEMKVNSVNSISREFLQDFYVDKELGLKEFIEERTKFLWNEMMQDFRKAQQSGWFRADLKPEFLFFLSQKMMEIITDENLLKLFASPQDMVKELANFFAYGMSPREDSK
jgi:AcrR family transcriptional regulator